MRRGGRGGVEVNELDFKLWKRGRQRRVVWMSSLREAFRRVCLDEEGASVLCVDTIFAVGVHLFSDSTPIGRQRVPFPRTSVIPRLSRPRKLYDFYAIEPKEKIGAPTVGRGGGRGEGGGEGRYGCGGVNVEVWNFPQWM